MCGGWYGGWHGGWYHNLACMFGNNGIIAECFCTSVCLSVYTCRFGALDFVHVAISVLMSVCLKFCLLVLDALRSMG